MFRLSLATRRITAALGAAALALGAITATAVPARANGDDLARLLAGTAALVIIGSAIHESGRKAHAAPVRPVAPAHGWRPAPNPPPRHGWNGQHRPGWGAAQPPRGCTVWLNGQRYVKATPHCGARRPVPVQTPPHHWQQRHPQDHGR